MDFDYIISLMPSLMDHLRNIWTQSAYYCRDDTMELLLQKMSNLFSIKARKLVNIHEVFK